MSGRLSGKVAVVTGGASGIGQAACRRIANEGCDIAVIDVDGEGAQRVAEECASAGVRVQSLCADVSDEKQIEAAIGSVLSHFKKLDLLVANAGIEGPMRDFGDITAAEFDRIMAVNVRGAFLDGSSLHSNHARSTFWRNCYDRIELRPRCYSAYHCLLHYERGGGCAWTCLGRRTCSGWDSRQLRMPWKCRYTDVRSGAGDASGQSCAGKGRRGSNGETRGDCQRDCLSSLRGCVLYDRRPRCCRLWRNLPARAGLAKPTLVKHESPGPGSEFYSFRFTRHARY